MKTQREKDLEAVKQNGFALEYVLNQTPEICLVAVKQYGFALEYVLNQTHEICLEAVKQNGYALRYVKNQKPEICIEAVKQKGHALEYVLDEKLKNSLGFQSKDIFPYRLTLIFKTKTIYIGCKKYSLDDLLNADLEEFSQIDIHAEKIFFPLLTIAQLYFEEV